MAAIRSHTPLCGWRLNERIQESSLESTHCLVTVISDALVAAKYNIMLRRLGVSISPFKSWISSSGACEFAKRFVLEGRGVDLSPISARMMNALTFSLAILCVVEKLKIELKSGRLCFRLHGAGYKVLSRLGHKIKD